MFEYQVRRMFRLNALKRLNKWMPVKNISKRFCTYEPEYLKYTKSEIPTYDALNVQIKGYDYPMVESFQSFVHKLAESMGIEVEDSWALPPQSLAVKKFKHLTTVVDSEYKLNKYERNVQIVDVPATVAPIFFYAIQESLPEGVSVRIHPHEDEYEELRYIPDVQLLELKSQLESLGGPSKKKG
ncbi:hypothetical protein J437_LFUL004130 [Ladona fulva]|uniref:Small ribosomal subunit protein uS10 domain-containing protein n=1 Tax=Ladona fulva TaxID=123851 RepID=A0A8K0JVT8_LADFU|nr:hypothetical protein J437_LFUL004130 [Ladona fulva]